MEHNIAISLALKDFLTSEGLRRILLDHGFIVPQCVHGPGELVESGPVRDEIVVLDASLLTDGGIAQVEALLERAPDARLIFLHENCDIDLIARAMALGAQGYILKSVPMQVFVTMVTLVSLGERVVPSEAIAFLHNNAQQPDRRDLRTAEHEYDLGDRERRVLDCLVMGMPNKMISRRLNVSEATVKATVKGIFRKMSVTNRTQAAMLAQEPTPRKLIGVRATSPINQSQN